MPPSGFSHQRSQSTSSLPPSSASIVGSSFGIHARHASTSLARGPGAHITRPTSIPSFRGYYYYYSLSLRTGSTQDVGGLLAGPLLGGRQQADKDAKEKEKKKKRGTQGQGKGGGGGQGGGGGPGGGKGTGFEVREGMSQNMDTTMNERGAAVAASDGKRVVVMVERIKVKKRSNFETLIKFGTDASGLERTFRLFQALAQCIAHIPSIRSIFVLILSSLRILLGFFFLSSTSNLSPPSKELFSPSAKAESQVITTALGVRSRLAQGRRFFRIFRFLDSFHSASTLYYQYQAQTEIDKSEVGMYCMWLDIMSKSFNGMYLLFETLGFCAALGVPGLDPWGPEVNRFLHVEGQRFWLFALVCGVIGGVVRLVYDRDLAGGGGGAASDGTSETEKENETGTQADDGHGNQLKEEERQRAALEQRAEEEQRMAIRMDRRMRTKRRITADLLDLAQPGAVVGWFPDWPGMIGLMMVGSTWLTGVEVWEKCAQ
ncbi:uncharacterized protein B0T23DRAFT_317285 [Neurospora hispaniola]|uniref:Uncharacterized protein n=1 Tax=Neurospora hispaniola TaxID=588809 RepID=A0AAJ0MRC6_9PEZI|nr:hypothetical protein B0T23DRAFT_317285 [Neurospora hispaniola]